MASFNQKDQKRPTFRMDMGETNEVLYRLRYSVSSQHTKESTTVKISPNGKYFATASSDATIHIFDLKSGSFVRSLSSHSRGISDIAWAQDSRHFASVSDDMTLRIWDVEFGECINVLEGHTYHVTCVEFNYKGNLLVTGSADEAIRIWDAQNGKCLKTLSAHSDPIASVDLSWDGTIIASASFDGLIRLFDTESGQCLKTLIYDKGGSSFPVSYIRFSPNGNYLLATTLDNTIRLWDYMNNRVVKTYQGGSGFSEKYTCGSRFVTTSKDPLIASGSENGKIYIWDLQSKKILSILEVSSSPVLQIDVCGKVLCSISLDGTVKVFDLSDEFQGYDSDRTDTD